MSAGIYSRRVGIAPSDKVRNLFGTWWKVIKARRHNSSIKK
jgi:hypothetical protein